MALYVVQRWIHAHGAPTHFSSDPEFQVARLKQFLKVHAVCIRPRPARRHNRTGIVEGNNGVFKAIFYRPEKETPSATAPELVSRAPFLSNLFTGSSMLSSFQLARGYSPSILGLPPTRVTQELLDAHYEQTALRAIQKLMHARDNNVIPSRLLPTGTEVYVYYNTSSNSVRM